MNEETVADGLGVRFFKAIKDWQLTFRCPKCGEPKLDIALSELAHPIVCRGCLTLFDLKEVKS